MSGFLILNPLALPLSYAGSEVNTSSWICDANGKRVCTMRANINDSDMAGQMIRATNSHHALVTALAQMRDAMRKAHAEGFLDFGEGECPEYLDEAEAASVAALAQARTASGAKA